MLSAYANYVKLAGESGFRRLTVHATASHSPASVVTHSSYDDGESNRPTSGMHREAATKMVVG